MNYIMKLFEILLYIFFLYLKISKILYCRPNYFQRANLRNVSINLDSLIFANKLEKNNLQFEEKQISFEYIFIILLVVYYLYEI